MSYVLARLREPSSYSGVAAALASIGIAVPSPLVQALALLGAGLAGLIAFFLPDKTE